MAKETSGNNCQFANDWSLLPVKCTQSTYSEAIECGLEELQCTLIRFATIILRLAGSAALLMFVIGGIMYILSGGDQGKVQKATGFLKYATIGLAMILLSGFFIRVLLEVLTNKGVSYN